MRNKKQRDTKRVLVWLYKLIVRKLRQGRRKRALFSHSFEDVQWLFWDVFLVSLSLSDILPLSIPFLIFSLYCSLHRSNEKCRNTWMRIEQNSEANVFIIFDAQIVYTIDIKWNTENESAAVLLHFSSNYYLCFMVKSKQLYFPLRRSHSVHISIFVCVFHRVCRLCCFNIDGGSFRRRRLLCNVRDASKIKYAKTKTKKINRTHLVHGNRMFVFISFPFAIIYVSIYVVDCFTHLNFFGYRILTVMCVHWVSDEWETTRQ